MIRAPKLPAPLATLLAATVLLAWAPLSRAEPANNCVQSCGGIVRKCLVDGRPSMRDCLRPCREGRRAAMQECTMDIDPAECPGVRQARGCSHACRTQRRDEVRRCLAAGRSCIGDCRQRELTPPAQPSTGAEPH